MHFLFKLCWRINIKMWIFIKNSHSNWNVSLISWKVWIALKFLWTSRCWRFWRHISLQVLLSSANDLSFPLRLRGKHELWIHQQDKEMGRLIFQLSFNSVSLTHISSVQILPACLSFLNSTNVGFDKSSYTVY